MKEKTGKSQLTPKQSLFVHEYVKDWNGTQAAIRAGYSAKTAEQQASRLLSNVKISSVVDKMRLDLQNAIVVSKERVLLEFARIAFADIRKAYNEEGGLKNIHDIDDDTAAAITAIESEELYEGVGHGREQIGNTKKIKMSSKVAALRNLAEHLKLFDNTSDEEKQRLIINIMTEVTNSSRTIEHESGGSLLTINPTEGYEDDH